MGMKTDKGAHDIKIGNIESSLYTSELLYIAMVRVEVNGQ